MSNTSMFDINEVRSRFESVLPEIVGRIRTYRRRFTSDADEAAAEMMALAWTGFVSKVRRTGVYLTPGQITFMAYRRVCDGRVAASGYSNTDALAPRAFKTGRVRRIFLSELTASQKTQELSDSTIKRIVDAMSTSWHERPCEIAATRIDWAAFSMTLPVRLQKLLRMLSQGYSKKDCAAAFAVSAGRITQLLYVIADELQTFFGPEIDPALS